MSLRWAAGSVRCVDGTGLLPIKARLLGPDAERGCRQLSPSHIPAGGFSLSVRRTELPSWDAVTHYRIHRLENGWLYISPRLTFPSLHDLVEHYSGKEPHSGRPRVGAAPR